MVAEDGKLRELATIPLNRLPMWLANIKVGGCRETRHPYQGRSQQMDIAARLGYKTPRHAVNRHCKGGTKRSIPSKGGMQGCTETVHPYQGPLSPSPRLRPDVRAKPPSTGRNAGRPLLNRGGGRPATRG